MNMFDRLKNVIDTQISKMFLQQMYEKGISVFRAKFGQQFKGYDELLTQASYVLTNSNPYIDFPRPMLHKTVPIGGITISLDRKKTALNETWNTILSERRYTVLISFGTVSKAAFMPEKYKKGLLEVFKSMQDTTFLWKYEGTEIDLANIPNVYLNTWFPQYALLSDNRLTAFITHAGLGSVTEAAFLGKPTIFIPVFSDQARNAKMMVRHRGGILMSKFDLEHPSKLRENLRLIINDPSYAENAKRLSDLLLNQPFTAKELAVKHCEFAARFGRTTNLDAYGRHLSFVQYYLIDVFSIIGLILSVVLFLTFKIVNTLLLNTQKTK
ncbi:unnamed protein product [Cylicocyclus nassatus]|uniref:UDP-glucuronosyltransferase n=1 Tax=Cylicocyclus nassatus TaxID=53992 RepID=A0AA36H5F7_CYLNA|nr:unnamed protein product [Cylicocyclus nassatus]